MPKLLKPILAMLLAVCLAGSGTLSLAAGKTKNTRILLDRPESEGNPGNLRLMAKGYLTLKNFKGRDEKELSAMARKASLPSPAGLDTLNISGSAQYSRGQFLALAALLRQAAGDREIVIVDLRQESHAFINGMSVCWFAPGNTANKGMDRQQVEADEAARFLVPEGTVLQVYMPEKKKEAGKSGPERSRKKGTKNIKQDVTVTRAETERQLAEAAGFTYLRLPAQDHLWPDAELIDGFISFVTSRDMDRTWYHFHCRAGIGRTGIFMCLYDMMKNPDVPLEDVLRRQALAGAMNLLPARQTRVSSDGDVSKQSKTDQRKEMIQVLWQYVQENHADGYQVRWSDWLENRSKEAA